MAQQKKSRKVGRPKLPKGEAKGRIVPVRFTTDDMKAIEAAAKAKKQTVSEWVRSTVLQLQKTLEYKGYSIEVTTREDKQGGFTTSGWITKQTGLGLEPISFATTDRHPTKHAALESGIAFCMQKIDGK